LLLALSCGPRRAGDSTADAGERPATGGGTLYAQGRRAAGNRRWPNEKALYEVNLEYYPKHSFAELSGDFPRLRDLGVNVIYVMPFWEAIADQRYLIRDYYRIDARYGGAAGLREMVASAHRQGLRVLLDLVTSLTYEGSKIMTDHPEFILTGDNGEKQRFFPFKEWGWALDCAKRPVMDYFAAVARHYVEQFGVDGWRIDSPMNNYDPKQVSTDHNRLNLLRAVKASVTKVKPEALFVCELSGPTLMWGDDDDREIPAYDEICQASYHYAFAGFLGGKKESGFNYVFFDGTPANGRIKVTPFGRAARGQTSSGELVSAVRGEKLLHGAMRANFIENHDTERVSYAFPERHRALFVMEATLPGVPVVHAGQEIGTTNPAGHYERKPPQSPVIRWKEGDRGLEAFYRQVLAVRRENAPLLDGEITNALAEGERPYVYLRTSGGRSVLVAVNTEGKAATATVRLPYGKGTLHDLLDKGSQSFEDARAEIVLPPYGYRLMRVER
jgi:glycosidase